MEICIIVYLTIVIAEFGLKVIVVQKRVSLYIESVKA